MPVNVVRGKRDERHWGMAKREYEAALSRGERITDKWRYINGTFQRIKKNSAKKG